MSLAFALLAFVTAQRLGELVLARRNTARLMVRGAVEVAPGHYPLVVAVHAAWLAGLWLFVVTFDVPVIPVWIALYAVLQVLRVWTLATLGERWTTRIVILPGAPLVTAGPYRWLSHPNYVVVAGEIAVLPLALGMPVYALAFSLLNAVVLMIRIRAEDDALRRPGETSPGS